MGAVTESGYYLIAFGALLMASAFFSGTEVALFSLRRADREQMSRSRRRADKAVSRLLQQPRQLIVTLLIGNEIVNVSMSAVMATVCAGVFVGYSETTVAVLTTAIVLPFVLLLGEITPKTVAFKTATGWSRRAARPLHLFGLVVTPLRLLVRGIVAALVFPFGVLRRQTSSPKVLDEGEFIALVDAGIEEGAVDARESRLIHRVFGLGDKHVAQVMRPAEETFLLPHDLPLTRCVAEVSLRGYSRVPVYDRSRDSILGILFAKDLLLIKSGLASTRRLAELLHPAMLVPQNMRLDALFSVFKQRKTHMALVVNERGKLLGLVTMEDLLEDLFGPIRDEKEVGARPPAGRGAPAAEELP